MSWFLPFVPRGGRFFKVYSGPGYPLDPSRQVVQISGDISFAPTARSVVNFQQWIIDHTLRVTPAALATANSTRSELLAAGRRLFRDLNVNRDQAWARYTVHLWNMGDGEWVLRRPNSVRAPEVFGQPRRFAKPRPPVLAAIDAENIWPITLEWGISALVRHS